MPIRVHGSLENKFSLGEALRPFEPDTTDRRMMLPPGEDGFGLPEEGLHVSMVRRVVAVICDVYLRESCSGIPGMIMRADKNEREDVCYWTIFTDLALSLFYFSVWELGTPLLSS